MEAGKTRYKIAVVAPTCFYYQAPLYRLLNAHPQLELKVYFCSDEALTGKDVMKKFNTNSQWGVEDNVISGYDSEFLKNYSPNPSYLKWPVGLLNFGIWGEIKRERPDLVVLMSWMNPTWWTAILACSLYKIPFLYLTDQNIQVEASKPKWLYWTKRILLGLGLFRITSGFLCAGTSNMELYQFYGVPNSKLVPFAYSWGYQTLVGLAPKYRAIRAQIRSELGISEDQCVFLYCGRLSQEKNPVQLLEAYHQIKSPRKSLVIVGDGNLRQQMQEFAAANNVESLQFFGFQDRNSIPKFYAMADALVLPSRKETWGMVVNEAMCFSLPVIVSDQVGAGKDLVKDDYNGFEFPDGNLHELTASLNRFLGKSQQERVEMGARSLEMITNWNNRDLASTLVEFCDQLYSVGDNQGKSRHRNSRSRKKAVTWN